MTGLFNSYKLFATVALLTFLVACQVQGSQVHSPKPSSTPNPIYALAESGVSSNGEWAIHFQEIDSVLMALVPSGCFMMGSTNNQIDYARELNGSAEGNSNFGDQQPAHQVCFSEPFWIDVYEVSQAQFAEYGGEALNESYFTGDHLPRDSVTWLEADAFCVKRGARLPTEAEWEYAARGPDDQLFPWGDIFECSNGNFDDEKGVEDEHVIDGFPNCDGYPTTAPVGKITEGASWVGALDLSGNVWEWVGDYYDSDYYRTLGGYAVDPQGPARGESHVLRGGAWSIDEADHLLAAFRGWYDPAVMGKFNLIGKHLGFRCARSFSVNR
jgi:formylglycine-generating enzyme required for sulfatase activity